MKNIDALNLNELAVLNAVKSGETTMDGIYEKTGIRVESVHEICKTLAARKYIEYNELDRVPAPKDSGKKIRLGGNLTLPVATFVGGDGQKYIVRGTWHKVTPEMEGITLSDIEWFDDQNKESDLQKAMRSITEQKAKAKKKTLPNIKDEDGEATAEHMKYLGAWRMVSDSIKIYPCEVSKNRAIIEISPRYIHDGIEFPYGSCSPKMVVPIEDMVAMIENGDESLVPTFSQEDACLYLPNCLPVQPSKNGWEYLSTKKTKDGVRIYHYDMQIVDDNGNPKESWTTLDETNLDLEQGKSYMLSIAKAFNEHPFFSRNTETAE